MYQQSIESTVVDYWKRIKVPNDSRFTIMSYKKQATRELLTYIRLHRDLHPLIAIEEFKKKAKEFADRGGKARYMFTVYYDTASDILYEIRKEKNRYYLY